MLLCTGAITGKILRQQAASRMTQDMQTSVILERSEGSFKNYAPQCVKSFMVLTLSVKRLATGLRPSVGESVE